MTLKKENMILDDNCFMIKYELDGARVAELARPRDQQIPKGQGLLRKEGPPIILFLLLLRLKFCTIHTLFEKLSESFKESQHALEELSMKANFWTPYTIPYGPTSD